MKIKHIFFLALCGLMHATRQVKLKYMSGESAATVSLPLNHSKPTYDYLPHIKHMGIMRYLESVNPNADTQLLSVDVLYEKAVLRSFVPEANPDAPDVSLHVVISEDPKKKAREMFDDLINRCASDLKMEDYGERGCVRAVINCQNIEFRLGRMRSEEFAQVCQDRDAFYENVMKNFEFEYNKVDFDQDDSDFKDYGFACEAIKLSPEISDELNAELFVKAMNLAWCCPAIAAQDPNLCKHHLYEKVYRMQPTNESHGPLNLIPRDPNHRFILRIHEYDREDWITKEYFLRCLDEICGDVEILTQTEVSLLNFHFGHDNPSKAAFILHIIGLAESLRWAHVC